MKTMFIARPRCTRRASRWRPKVVCKPRRLRRAPTMWAVPDGFTGSGADSFYPADMPTGKWFEHYVTEFDTVELNASFYSWPTTANVKTWKRQPRDRKFIYTVKVCELITHIKKFRGTKTLVKDFGLIADILGDRMGCFLFQLPPSYRYSKTRLKSILSQIDSARRNVVEFRHASWWNETVYKAFREAGAIFCSCSGPRLPDELVKTADEAYVRLHGPERWYRHNYSADELRIWAHRIKASGAKRAWIYFNNDNDAFAIDNAKALRRLLNLPHKRRAEPEVLERAAIAAK